MCDLMTDAVYDYKQRQFNQTEKILANFKAKLLPCLARYFFN